VTVVWGKMEGRRKVLKGKEGDKIEMVDSEKGKVNIFINYKSVYNQIQRLFLYIYLIIDISDNTRVIASVR
jgi:hypothetical protein